MFKYCYNKSKLYYLLKAFEKTAQNVCTCKRKKLYEMKEQCSQKL